MSGSLAKSGWTRAAVQLATNSAYRALPRLEIEMLDLRDWKISLLDGRPSPSTRMIHHASWRWFAVRGLTFP